MFLALFKKKNALIHERQKALMHYDEKTYIGSRQKKLLSLVFCSIKK